jgi:hypothetical protein
VALGRQHRGVFAQQARVVFDYEYLLFLHLSFRPAGRMAARRGPNSVIDGDVHACVYEMWQ